MKIKIFAISFLISLFFPSSYAFNNDAFYYRTLEHKGIKKITENTHDKWEVVSFFDEKGYLLRETNLYKKEIRSDYKYSYVIVDTLLEIRRIDMNCKDTDKQKRVDRYYYTSLGQCYKHEICFSESDTSSYYEHDFVFDDELLIGYTQGNGSQGEHSTIKYKYNEKKQKIQEQKMFMQTDTTFCSYIYNSFGQLTDCIQESNDSEVIYSDVVVWNNKKMNKVHIRYSDFDKQGNWTKSYFITEKGKVFRSKREIEYYE
ncbi:hypothetical protein M2132_000954 [Dysgonomonas sp. PH5-45]|uniref:hypothetical protein n=1 Tax=unclassified Dysgonomonas TaxID=2630389 RepID=UPI00247667B0|nr:MULTISPECIES: hypothetical protein [unclassified Dysgonomonas]MDH6354626.1 hypothetical protein [Dysgonomonas sp. PH5-45]MDH6387524.1 hypothetical protein [Dysgonomonas sp. PH5-37]